MQCSLIWPSWKRVNVEANPINSFLFSVFTAIDAFQTPPSNPEVPFTPIVQSPTMISCPDDCTSPSQGTCDRTTGVCTCEFEFTGSNCADRCFLPDFPEIPVEFIPQLIGDGRCHFFLNFPRWNYDGGDCCTNPVTPDICVDLECIECECECIDEEVPTSDICQIVLQGQNKVVQAQNVLTQGQNNIDPTRNPFFRPNVKSQLAGEVPDCITQTSPDFDCEKLISAEIEESPLSNSDEKFEGKILESIEIEKF